MIKEACYDIGRDYQNEGTWEEKFFTGIAYCLNRLPTDIAVFNNNTLRNPKLHFAYSYLLERCPKLAENQWIMKQKEVKKEFKFNNKILIPPPLQYDLALDLNSEQHPFAFCYGNQNGYCIDYEGALEVFISDVNLAEKKYFYYLLSCPPQKLNYLNEIPEEIRKEENEIELIKNLDNWLEQNETSTTAIKIKEFIDYKITQLPNFIKTKLQKLTLKFYSTISLFNSLFYHYPSEDVYTDQIELPIPEIDLELQQTLTDELKADENSLLGGFGGNAEKKWFCWGLQNYGGF